MRKIFWFFLLVLIAMTGHFLIVFLNPNSNSDPTKKEQTEVCVKEVCYKVESMVTPVERARGMMFREDLDEYRGMLFEFEQNGIYPFWMKNTLIPLDIVWIGANKKIVYISAGTLPCQKDPCVSINPGVPARCVLETNSGQMEKIGAKVGDTVLIKN